MATSFVSFHGRGFWSHDIFVEGSSYLLAREFDKLENKKEWVAELVEEWKIAATAGFSGCVPTYFEKFNTHDKVQMLRNILEYSLVQLKKHPDFLTLAEMEGGISRRPAWDSADTIRLSRFIQLLLQLIDGQLRTDASSPIDYWTDD